MIIDKLRSQDLDGLFEMILMLENIEECYLFFDDLCTLNEIRTILQRYQVAKMLYNNNTYREIEVETGAGSATISRTKRSLNDGNDMYKVLFNRLKKENNTSSLQ